MAFVPVAGTARVAVRFELPDNALAINVFHIKKLAAGAIVLGDLQDVANIIVSAYDTHLDVTWGGHCTLVGVQLRSLESEAGLIWDAVMPAGGIIGTRTGNALPNHATIAVQLVTGLAGRSYRGRLYHPGLVDAQVVNNSLVVTDQENILDGYEELRGAIVDDGTFVMSVVSYVSNGAPRAVPLSTTVSGFRLADATIDTQRRRMPGGPR